MPKKKTSVLLAGETNANADDRAHTHTQTHTHTHIIADTVAEALRNTHVFCVCERERVCAV